MVERKHLLHFKSKDFDINTSYPKLPNSQDVEYGEIAINYLSDNEKIAIKNSNDNIITFSSDKQNEYKFTTKEQLLYLSNVIDEKINNISDSVVKINTSCGFNGEFSYTPKNELIQDCTTLSDAIELVAEKANEGIDTSTFATKEEVKSSIELTNYLKSHNTVETLTNIPIDKYLVIANINTATASLTLADTLKEMQEIHIIVHNTSPNEVLTITLPSIGGFINLTETTIPVAVDKYCEINIISDGNNMYIRAI